MALVMAHQERRAAVLVVVTYLGLVVMVGLAAEEIQMLMPTQALEVAIVFGDLLAVYQVEVLKAAAGLAF
jgi:hypothetical protein